MQYLNSKTLVFISLFGLALLVSACTGSTEKKSVLSQSTTEALSEGPEIRFEKEVHDFGKIISGERVSYHFRFTNSGDSPLIITSTRSGCGCTVGDYPKEPVLPGQSGRITVVFNSAGRSGFQSETVRVLTNAPQEIVNIRIQAEVVNN